MRRLLVVLLVAGVLSGCAGGPQRRAPASGSATSPSARELGRLAADQARELIGAPYRYGGADPSGFDCSGLVWYVYQRLGVVLPRRASEQRKSLPSVARRSLKPGDLVFFSTPADHVGIYLGDGSFVHAPRTGKAVSLASLDAPFFEDRFTGAARVAAP